jgi:hypothetical protein
MQHERESSLPGDGGLEPLSAADEKGGSGEIRTRSLAWSAVDGLRSSRVLAAIGITLWLALVTWRLGSVPGMSLDEAWSILAAREQWVPANPLSGMTSYSGPFPVLLLRLTGTESGVLILRAASVVANGSALILIGLMFRRFYPGRAHAVWALPLIATSPVWLIVLRTGIEVVMFMPLLVVLGLYLFSRATRSAVFFAGFVWGLCVYNHLIGACFPIAIALAWLITYRRWPPIPLGAAILGGLLGLAPRIIAVCFYSMPLEGTAARYSLLAALGDLRWWPLCLWRTLQGETVYLRYVGRLAVEPWPYWILGLVFITPWLGRLSSVPRAARFALLASILGGLLVTLAAPYIAVRFFILPVIALTAFLVMLGAAAIEKDAAWRWPIAGTALVLTLFNLFYVIHDFHRPWQRGELGITKFFLGDRSKRTGNWAYFPKEQLALELRALTPAPEQVVTVPTLERPLRVLLDGSPLSVVLASNAAPERRSVFVDYLYPDSPERHCAGVAGGELCFTNPAIIGQFYVIYPDR